MALIKCDNCHKEISDTSKKCIHCGYNIVESVICPECNSKNDKNTLQCTNCGYQLRKSKERENDKKFNIKKVILAVSLSIVGFVIISIIVINLVKNLNEVDIPNVINLTEANATSTISATGLIPVIEYEYNNEIQEGNVIDTYPQFNADKNSQITVYVSKGPSIIYAKSSNMQWYNVSYNKDKWEFNNPTIKKDKIYIDCEATFQSTFNFVGNNAGIGRASINDTYDKTVPIQIVTEDNNLQVNANQLKKFTLEIPISGLDNNKPSSLFTKLAIEVNGVSKDIDVSFTIEW